MSSFYRPADELKCQYCLKTKDIEKYTLTWQRRHRVCNYCKEMYANVGSVVKPKNDTKPLPCLRCGKTFNTVKEVRICSGCKDSAYFKEDKFIDYINQAVGLAL